MFRSSRTDSWANQLSGLQQVKSGELQGSELAMGVMSNLFPKITFTDLPYVMPDMAVAQKLYTRENPVMKKILTEMEEKTGVGILFFSPQAYRQISTAKKPNSHCSRSQGCQIAHHAGSPSHRNVQCGWRTGNTSALA